MPSIAPHDFDSHILTTGFIDSYAFFITSSGLVTLLLDKAITIEAHNGIASAALAQDEKSIFTGGEDGRICQIDSKGTIFEKSQQGRKWITALATGQNGAFAFATGKNAWVQIGDKNADFIELNHERSVEALAFAKKGQRLAVARYNGVTLHWLGTNVAPVELAWKGAHFNVLFSPDNRYVISAMQENALHGWRLSDGQDLRMSGYPTKVKSWSWSNKGKWLATSGAMAAIVWPFQAKDGPMGKAPLELGTRSDTMVCQVACHVSEDMVAIGYEDGMILLVRFSDAKEVLLKRPGKGAISALAWDKNGTRLAFGSASGEAGIIDITS